MRSAVVGIRAGLSIDHLVSVGRPPAYDVLGGPALYGALGAALIAGARPRVLTGLPRHDSRFAEVLSSRGVDLTTSTVVDDVPRVWMLTAPTGRRVVEVASTHGLELLLGAPDPNCLNDPDHPDASSSALPHAFTAGLDALLDSSPADQPNVARRVVVGTDPHQGLLATGGVEHLRKVVPPGGVLLPSRVHLGLVDADPRAATRRLAADLDVAVVARLDRDGLYVVAGPTIWTVTDYGIEVHETTGAGDASAGAVVAALAIGCDLPTAAMFGASVARLVLGDIGHLGLLASDPLEAPLDGIHSQQEIS